MNKIKSILFASVFFTQFPSINHIDDWILKDLINCLIKIPPPRRFFWPNLVFNLQILIYLILVTYISLHVPQNGMD